MQKAWEIIIDLATLIWLGVFAASLLDFGAGLGDAWLAWASAVIGAVFVADIVVIFCRAVTWRDFFARA